MKSFARVTKEELCAPGKEKPCCKMAQYAAMAFFGTAKDEHTLRFVTENQDVLSVWADLSCKMGIFPTMQGYATGANRYSATVENNRELEALLSGFLRKDDGGRLSLSIKKSLADCCLKSFLKGVFLSCGTLTDPQKTYSLELVLPEDAPREPLQQLLEKAGFSFKYAIRKGRTVLYLKNSESISDFLAYMGAYRAQMSLLNIKIEKEMRNELIRSHNSEVANYDKVVTAAVEQIHAIQLLEEKTGLRQLPEELREIARLRLEHKDMSLSKLGQCLTPPLSKSGVNHRLKKLIEMANDL